MSYINKGEKFNRLTTTENILYCRDKSLFECECGNKKRITAESVKNGHTKSCGCLRKEIIIQRNIKHGYCYHIAYPCWADMINRCYNSKAFGYKNYGGRRITICPEWRYSPKEFCDWATNNGHNKKLQLDRINNNGNYTPENCRFVTRSENLRNKRNNCLLTAFNETKCMAEWVDDKRCKVGKRTLSYRVKKLKWLHKKAITMPARKSKTKKK